LSTVGAAEFGALLAGRFGDHGDAPAPLVARAHAAFGRHGFTALLAPPTPDAVAEALALCSAEGWPVVPLGAATWLPGPIDKPASLSPVLLSTARLDGITEHEPADLVIGVQAGLPLHRLDQALRASRLWLPLDPPAASDATIGAVAALSAAGPLRAGHGTPRDMALGVEIATGDGRLIRFGGRVV
jgi:FAD/FMN-containing dehydrogenase